jgi:ABC-type dipeptide/oligopeptide/nickel transport system ATPase component
MTDLLRVQGLSVEFDTPAGRRRVVDDVSFSVGEGKVLGVLGESGSGKTVSTLAVLGLIAGRPGVIGGSIVINDQGEEIDLLAGIEDYVDRTKTPVEKKHRRWDRLTGRRMRDIWGRFMTAVFQNPRASLDPLMTVGMQVEESVRLADPELSADAAKARAIDWLERVQLNEPVRVYGSYAHELSGGMCQRAMIAVALARRPKLLIADEPTTGLDTTVRADIVRLFETLIREEKRSMMYISHDIREVLYLSDHVIVMRHGKIVDYAPSEILRKGGPERAEYTRFLLAAADLIPSEVMG